VDQTLWAPSDERIASSELTRFRQFLSKKGHGEFADYEELHRFSVEKNQLFWSTLFEFYSLVYSGDVDASSGGEDFLNYNWFEGVSLNFCENLLDKGDTSKTAFQFVHESGQKKSTTYGELRSVVGSLRAHLEKNVGVGDVVAAYMPNIPQTVSTMLATTALGGIFTSTSCDFGIEGVLDRFGQTRPTVLVAAISYSYNGKIIDQTSKIQKIIESLPSLKEVIVVDFLGDYKSIPAGMTSWKTATSQSAELTFKRVPFSHPAYIMYSSGTTGKPKCIVHSVGGTLLQHVKELGLHNDLTSEKCIFYFTTCGWMMWNWLVSSLYFGAKIVLYEGSPACPDITVLFQMAHDEKVNIFGTSPKFLKAFEQSGHKIPAALDSLETILSTGAPLLPEQYDFVYENIKSDVALNSISGGTDILGCFLLGCPIKKVKRGQLSCKGLGMDVACVSGDGKEVIGTEGELICKKSFPSQPVGFWKDEEQVKFKAAYFEKYPGIWHHGDFIQLTEDGYATVLGRSDATLNPGGVRIGTSEIYRQTETLAYIEDGLCVGKEVEGEVQVLLFLKMREKEDLSELRVSEIKGLIKKNTTPRHVPAAIFSVPDIPYTRSGKKMEMAVMRILNSKPLTNIEAVANPTSLEWFQKFNWPS
jgi:acetoacetyl-CoA synthetase